jgi:hypothetical protein
LITGFPPFTDTSQHKKNKDGEIGNLTFPLFVPHLHGLFLRSVGLMPQYRFISLRSFVRLTSISFMKALSFLSLRSAVLCRRFLFSAVAAPSRNNRVNPLAFSCFHILKRFAL